jgi:hypothetical protein
MGKKHSSSSGEKRDPMISYHHKVDKITKWWNHLKAHHQEKDGKGNIKQTIKPLDFYISQIKQPKS